MLMLWPLLDVEDLDGSFEDWLMTAQPVVNTSRAASSRLAANYLTVLRGMQAPGAGPVVPTLAETVDPRALLTSMLVTGPVAIKRAMAAGRSVAAAAETASATSAAAGMRHALDGGRQTIVDTVKEDRRAAGWTRITSGNACPFCEMLAGRGAVYGAESGDFQAHDHCSCSAAPEYR